MSAIKKELLEHIHIWGRKLEAYPWENKKAYAHWMAQTYFYIRHTTCLIALSASKWGVQNREAQYEALKHLRQETAHDILLLNDLKALGEDIEGFQESTETQTFYQTQYYWIQNTVPEAHLGYAYLLEGAAAYYAGMMADRVVAAHGKGCASFLKTHSEEDVLHFEEGVQRIETLTPQELQYFRDSMRQTALLYPLMLQRALADSKK